MLHIVALEIHKPVKSDIGFKG